MERREYILRSGAVIVTGIGGCLGSANPEDYAEGAIETIDNELGVDEYDVDEDAFHIYFYSSGNPGHDIQVVGGAYAGAVNSGLEAPAYAYALDGDGSEVYWFDIESGWAQQFMDEQLSEEEYLGLIEETIR